VVDAGLCHGAAGLAHIYNRAWQATGDGFFAEAARAWLGRALAMRQEIEGAPHGFTAFLPGRDGKLAWMPDAALLTGAGGVALALMAAATAVEPCWDRILLVSLPPV
jgi:hypothetical protein